jgi:hypothetical protein
MNRLLDWLSFVYEYATMREPFFETDQWVERSFALWCFYVATFGTAGLLVVLVIEYSLSGSASFALQMVGHGLIKYWYYPATHLIVSLAFASLANWLAVRFPRLVRRRSLSSWMMGVYLLFWSLYLLLGGLYGGKWSPLLPDNEMPSELIAFSALFCGLYPAIAHEKEFVARRKESSATHLPFGNAAPAAGEKWADL